MGRNEVKVLGMWASPFALRAEWALKLKGVEYDYVNEDLQHKSEDLIRFNPIYKKIPVLLHRGKAVAESLLIIEYIDEAWTGDGYYNLLPKDPYDRAMARFWARFVDDKIEPKMRDIYRTIDKVQKNDVEDVREHLRMLGGALNGNKFFGGESIGYLDIAVGWIPLFLRMFKQIAGVDAMEGVPEMEAWAENFLSAENIKERLPSLDDLCNQNKRRREQLLAAKTQ